jgi:hypothetical protein
MVRPIDGPVCAPSTPSAQFTPSAPFAARDTRQPRRANSTASSRQSRDTFGDVGSLTELRAQAQRIRMSEKIWQNTDSTKWLAGLLNDADSASLQVLSHYRNSVERLNRKHPGGLTRFSNDPPANVAKANV